MTSRNEEIPIFAQFEDKAIPLVNAPRQKRTESITAQLPRLDQTRKMILRLGQKTLGVPPESVIASLAAINNLERLENLLESMGQARTWQQLLALP